MDRCKLEYMIKRFEFKEKKRIIQEMDPYADYFFNKDLSNFLVNPDTEDMEILKYVGPYSLMYYIAFLNEDSELDSLYKVNNYNNTIQIPCKLMQQTKKRLCK